MRINENCGSELARDCSAAELRASSLPQRLLFLAGLFAAVCLPAATLNVTDNASLSSALATVQPGDTVLLADGTYSGFTLTRSGTAAAPILIKAATRGAATIASGIIRLSQTSYVTIEGLTITTPGSSQPVDGESFRVAVWFDSATHCRLTRCTLRLSGHSSSTHWVMLGGSSQHNRIDHCEFGPNSVANCHLIWPRGNRTIAGVTPNPTVDRGPWAEGRGPFNPNMARHTRIDHNYFHDHLPTTDNGGETIVLGGLGMTGDYQDTFTVIEHNLWDNCWGDAELVSVKTSSSTIRYNTVRRSGGGFVSRAGNKTRIYGNFMLQEGRTGSGGIRLHEKDHLVYNNYIERTAGEAIHVGDGDPHDSASFTHGQVVRARIVHNTFVDCGAFDTSNAHPLDPIELVVANNILLRTNYSGHDVQPGWAFAQNFISPNNPNRAGFNVVDPQLVRVGEIMQLAVQSPAIDAAVAAHSAFILEDVDGHVRSAPDVGADEFSVAAALRRPLTAADVGPNAPEDNAPPVITAAPGGHTIASGETAALTVGATGSGINYQWKRNGVAITGATDATYFVRSAGSEQAGVYSVAIANSAGSSTSGSVQLEVTTTNDPGRISNLSIRSMAGTGEQTLIVGAVLGGDATTGARPLLLRAAGPSLVPFGVGNALADPSLELLRDGSTLAVSHDWNNDAQIAAVAAGVHAFPFTTSRDAALFRPDIIAGRYDMKISGVSDTTGVALAEIYDAALAPSPTAPRLVNVSARTQTGAGASVLIAGFVIGGTTSKTVLVRAIGPSLVPFGVSGVLTDPRLELYRGDTLLHANDDWENADALRAAFAITAAFSIADISRDAALLVTLPPGNYTAQVTGGGATGVALVEVYEVK